MQGSAGKRIGDEAGFTLVELLVVILVLGILAAVGLPGIVAQQAKGHDADAKSNARNAVSTVEACFVERRAYTSCDSPEELEAAGAKLPTELTDTTAKKKNAISLTATADAYTIVGYSKSDNAFTISKAAEGGFTRTCTSGGKGGCKSGDVW